MFSRAELSGMRDWSRARNFSPSRAEFRRDHERRRARGLQLRHAERLGQLCEREAGCFPADLRVPWATVDDGRSGVTDLPPPSTARPETGVPAVGGVPAVSAVQRPGLARDPRIGQGLQAGQARRPEPTGEPRRQPQGGPSAEPRPTRPNRGRRAADALSGQPIPICHHAPETDRAGVTTPGLTARQPCPDPAGKHQTRPARHVQAPVSNHGSQPRSEVLHAARVGTADEQPARPATARPATARPVGKPGAGNNPTTRAPNGRQARRCAKTNRIPNGFPKNTVSRFHPELSIQRRRPCGGGAFSSACERARGPTREVT